MPTSFSSGRSLLLSSPWAPVTNCPTITTALVMAAGKLCLPQSLCLHRRPWCRARQLRGEDPLSSPSLPTALQHSFCPWPSLPCRGKGLSTNPFYQLGGWTNMRSLHLGVSPLPCKHRDLSLILRIYIKKSQAR